VSQELSSTQKLALAISSCDEVCNAFKEKSHPCHKVSTWQLEKIGKVAKVEGSIMHRPEAWTGDLEKAKIVVLASNPSFDKKELFPDWSIDWSEENIIDFAVNRFGSKKRKYGATDGPALKDADKTIGKDGALSKKRVKYWKHIRNLIATILEKEENETSAVTDYVMTELVHCKSEKEAGVPRALDKCAEKWFEQIMAISPARLILILGGKPAKHLAKLYPEIPEDWGRWADRKTNKGKGSWPRTRTDLDRLIKKNQWSVTDQLKNSVVLNIAGIDRLVVFLGRPGGGDLCSMTEHPDLVDPYVIREWRKYI